MDADLATLRDWIGDPEDYSDEDRGAAERACDACDGVEAELSRLREERDGRVSAKQFRELRADYVAAEARCARLEEERDEYRIEADHGHDDYEDAEAVIRQIAETRPNQAFDPWARDLCREFLDRPRRSRQTIATIRERCARLQQALADAKEARRGVISACIAVKGKLDQPYPDDERWTPWTRFVEPALLRLDEALAGPDTPADSQEDKT